MQTEAGDRVSSGVAGLKPTALEIDGNLDDPSWASAVTSANFWCSFENREPSDATEVLVMMDGDYLYFGFRLYDSEPESIQARRTVRDTGFAYDDVITVELDTYFNRRDISSFSMNPLGTQSDDLAGGRSEKVEWKGDWLGAATKTEYGWSAEFAIPFSVLNYRSQDTVFGLNFKRYQSRTREYSWWADVSPLNLSEMMGSMTGLELPELESRKVWTFMPFVLAGKNIPNKSGTIKDTLVTGGIDIRYQPRPDWTGVISLNPDFSQVEDAVEDISFSYTEKAVADNRPFFAEGADYFSDGEKYFYSNRVADFDYGAKTFGRYGANQFAVLATGAPDDRNDFVGRWIHEIDERHSATGTVVATRQTAYDNMLGLLRFDGRRGQRGLTYAADLAMTDTSDLYEADPRSGEGTHFNGSLGWQEDYWSLSGTMDRYDVNYFPALALLSEDLPGTRGYSTNLSYYREQSNKLWRVLEGNVGYTLRETESGDVQNRKWYVGGSVEFESQIRTSLYAEEGPYRPVGDERGEFRDYMYQDRYYSATVDFLTRSNVVSFGAQYDWGQLGSGDYEHYLIYGWWRPVDTVQMQVSHEITESFGRTEQTIASGSWQFTPEDSVGGRIIVYSSEYGSDNYYRLTYGRKVRQGIDLYLVYDNSPYQDEQYSIKLVKTF